MLNEVDRLKARYAEAIEDGRKIEVFTSMPEWQWYVEHVIKPTLDDYTNRILTGVIPSDKEDWITRGMIMGLKLVIDSPEGFKQQAIEAKAKSKKLAEEVEDDY